MFTFSQIFNLKLISCTYLKTFYDYNKYYMYHPIRFNSPFFPVF